MLTIYFCLDGHAPVMRCWSVAPRIGETVTLPELGGRENPLTIYEIVWEGFDEPSVNIYLTPAAKDRLRAAHEETGAASW